MRRPLANTFSVARECGRPRFNVISTTTTGAPKKPDKYILGLPIPAAAGILIAGIWVYRPWCQFFCPFGLVSWLAERISITRPRVKLKICIDCLRCERECPNWSIRGIRRGHKAPQDCFACGTCIRVCPVNAIRWNVTPPPDRPEPQQDAESEDAT